MWHSADKAARKAQLAEAVWQVILDRGISAVSVRSVAQQAELAVGSLRHLFPTRTELLTFSAELMVQRATERALSTPRYDDPKLQVLEILKHFLPLEPQSRAEMEVNIALIAESASEPELRPIRDHAHQQLFEGCLRWVTLLAGVSVAADNVQVARRLHALTDGLAAHLLVRESAADTEWAVAILRDEIERIYSDFHPAR